MRLIYVIVGLALIIGAASAAGITAKLITDTYVCSEEPGDSYGEDSLLWVSSSQGEPVDVAYLGFMNNFGTSGITASSEIGSATLKLTVSEVDEPGKVMAYFYHGVPMDTWFWEDRGVYDEGAFAEAVVDEKGTITVDVTDIIKAAVDTCSEDCDYSIVLVADGDASVAFASRESAQGAELSYVRN